MVDYGTLRGVIALIILGLFIIIVLWSYSKKREKAYDEAANSIFEEDDIKNQKTEISKQETNNV